MANIFKKIGKTISKAVKDVGGFVKKTGVTKILGGVATVATGGVLGAIATAVGVVATGLKSKGTSQVQSAVQDTPAGQALASEYSGVLQAGIMDKVKPYLKYVLLGGVVLGGIYLMRRKK